MVGQAMPATFLRMNSLIGTSIDMIRSVSRIREGFGMPGLTSLPLLGQDGSGSRMAREYSEVHDTKYEPRYNSSSDDDWAIGVETLGLDDATVQSLIYQVNKESQHWNTAGTGKHAIMSGGPRRRADHILGPTASPVTDRRESYAYISPERE